MSQKQGFDEQAWDATLVSNEPNTKKNSNQFAQSHNLCSSINAIDTDFAQFTIQFSFESKIYSEP